MSPKKDRAIPNSLVVSAFFFGIVKITADMHIPEYVSVGIVIVSAAYLIERLRAK